MIWCFHLSSGLLTPSPAPPRFSLPCGRRRRRTSDRYCWRGCCRRVRRRPRLQRRGRDRVAGIVLDLSIVADFKPAEGNGDAGRHGIGLVRWLAEALAPVGLVTEARNGLTMRSRPSSAIPSCISSDQSVSQSACSAEAAIMAS